MSEPVETPKPTGGPFRAIVFDVNETLLDLSALDPVFTAAFGDRGLRRRWFADSLRLAFVSTLVGRPPDFAVVGQAALKTLASEQGVAFDGRLAAAIADGMRSLPPHPDVPPSLARLRAAGFVLATLTNNPPAVLAAQLDQSGLAPLFDHVLSAAEAGRLKPAPDPYRMALTRLGRPAHEILFVAAHGWDLAGAAAAGLPTAFLARPDQHLDPLAPPPLFNVPDLAALADALLGLGAAPS
jgi:2-haloacid dehalogenase